MMDRLAGFFSWTLTTSAMASVLILLILLARFLLKDKLKPRWSYVLWSLLVLRLILPWTPESSFSVFNILRFDNDEMSVSITLREVTQPVSFGTNADGIATVQPPTGSALDDKHEIAPPAYPSTVSSLSILHWLSLVWLTGAVTMLAVRGISSARFAARLKREPEIRDEAIRTLFEHCKDLMRIKRSVRLVESSRVSTPTLFGVFRPMILLQHSAMNALNASQLRHVILHEMSHIKRNDIAINWLMNILLAVHWFNPLLWYAYRKMRSDQEMACDALALSKLKPEETREYALTIIRLLETGSDSVRLAGAAGVSGSKKDLKRRVAMIASFNKNSRKWSLPALAVMLLISGCALTGPQSAEPPQGMNTEAGEAEAAAVMPSAVHPDFPVPKDAALTEGEAGNPNIKKHARYNWKEADEIGSIEAGYLKEIETAGWTEKKDEQMGAMRVFEKNGTVIWLITHNGFFTLSELENGRSDEGKPSADASPVVVSELRHAAWNSLTAIEMKEVVIGGWDTALVEAADVQELSRVQYDKTQAEAEHVYKVTFHTNRDELLGPIQVFIHSDTKEIIGRGPRR